MEANNASVQVSAEDDDDINYTQPIRENLLRHFAAYKRNRIIYCSMMTAVATFGIVVTFAIYKSVDKLIGSKPASPQQIPTDILRVKMSIEQQYNSKVDPCQDFYKFSCGRVLEENVTSYAALKQLGHNLMFEIKDILETPSAHTKSKAFQQAKQLYATCMQQDDSKSEDLSNILNSSLVGQWPILQRHWDDSQYNLEKILGQLFVHSVSNIIDFKFQINSTISSNLLLMINMGTTGIPLKYLVDDANKYQQVYKDAILKVAAHLRKEDLENLESTVKQDAEDIVLLESSLAKLIVNSSCASVDEDTITNTYSSNTSWISAEELEIILPEINWKKLIYEVHEQVSLPSSAISNTTIGVQCPEELFAIAKLTKKIDKRIVANYLVWRLVLHYLPIMGSAFHNISLELQNADSGIDLDVDDDSQNWFQCVQVVNTVFTAATAYGYIQTHPVEASAITVVEEMIHYFRNALNNIISGQQWLPEVKVRLVEKLTNTVFNIGYPSFLLDTTALDKQYEGLELHENSTFLQFLEVIKFSRLLYLRLLWKNDPDRFWYYKPLVHGNAYHFHDISGNGIVIPFTLLRYPFFSKAFPMFLNYARLGTMIAHEIAHVSDLTVLRLNSTQTWWTEKEAQLFHNKTECYVEQYGQYRIKTGEYLDGKKTLDENLSDNLGLKMAWSAYNLWRADHVEVMESLLPGMKFTIPQLFYLTYSQLWCEHLDPEMLRHYIQVDTHSPGEFRVKGSIDNDLDFGAAFHCPYGSEMNPDSKCQLWE